jgi:hypothetical protein
MQYQFCIFRIRNIAIPVELYVVVWTSSAAGSKRVSLNRRRLQKTGRGHCVLLA